MVTFEMPLKIPLVDGNCNYSATAQTINAAGESQATVFRVWWPGGTSGDTKTFSSAGGKILFSAATGLVFSDAGTTVRVGLQGVDANGLEDGVWSVYTDLVGGGGGITNNAKNTINMANGSTTLSYGQLVAVVIEMTSRGGSDTLIVSTHGGGKSLGNSTGVSPFSLPHGTGDTGAGPAISTNILTGHIIFNDGVYGYYGPGMAATVAHTGTSAANATDTSAIGYTFIAPITFQMTAVSFMLASNVLTPGMNVQIRQDPYGADTLVNTYLTPYNAVGTESGNNECIMLLEDNPTFTQGVEYAILVYPAYAGTVQVQRSIITSGFISYHRTHSILGSTLKSVSYAISTNTYTDQTTSMPLGQLFISGVETPGASSGGGSFPFG
jgi:hypothetical protein